MSKLFVASASLLAVMAMSGCATNRYCQGEQPYQEAGSLPVLKDAKGVEIPKSTAAMEIPEGSRSSGGFGESYVDKKGKTRDSCLDTPPRLAEIPAEQS